MIETIEESPRPKVKCKMDMHSGLWRIPLTERVSELVVFVTPSRQTYRWLIMRCGVHRAAALFQGTVNKVIAEVLKKECVQMLVKEEGAVLKAHIDDIFVGATSCAQCQSYGKH